MPMLRDGTQDGALNLKGVELMIRRLQAVFVIALVTVPFSLATSAVAQTCDPTDLGCTVDQVGGTGKDVTDDPVGAAHDGGDTAANTGQGAVGTAQGVANDPVGTVRNTIDQVLGDGGITPPTGGGGGGPGGGSGHGPGGSDTASHNPHGGAGTSRHAGGAIGRGGSPATVSSTGSAGAGVPAGDVSSHASDHRLSPTIGAVAVGVIGGVALMALLLGAVVAFLALQERIDRRDPKLAMAAVGSDRVSFA